MKKTNKAKSKKPKKVNSKPKAKKTKVAAKQPEETMDRKTLIGIARLLKGAGSEVKALKSDADLALQKKLNEAIQKLAPPDVIKLLESIDPGKLVNGLKQDCLGIFVDLSDVSCTHCPDVTACVGKFIGNLRGGFSHVKGALGDDGPKPAAAAKQAVVPVTRYEAKRAVFIKDVPNPNPKGDDLHDTIRRVLKEQPETLGELREIMERDFDFDSDADFMTQVTAFRDPKDGVIKLDVDLSDADKEALRAAGYDV